MVDSASITVTNHRLRKAMSNVNDDDFKSIAKQLGDDLKSELKIQIGRVLEICADTETAIVQINGSSNKETCLIAHDIFSEGMSVDGFPRGKTEIRHKQQYIIPSEKLYGLICTVKDSNSDKKILLSYVNRKKWNNLDRCKAGEYKLQVGDNIISLTENYIKINSDNLFINGLPYTEAYEPLDDYYTKKDIDNTYYTKNDIESIVKQVLNDVYPVGSIYMSIEPTNPSQLFGGIWERLEDRFLLGASDNYPIGETKGEATHTLTVEEIPSHTHIQNPHNHTQNPHNHTQNSHQHELSGTLTGGLSSGNYLRSGVGSSRNNEKTDSATATNKEATATNKEATATNNETGGGQAHNNMPPYLSVFMWKRIR